MIDIKKTILKSKKVCYIFVLNSINNSVLDIIADKIKNKNVIIQLKQGHISTNNFYNISLKIRQLVSYYDSLLIIEDRIDVANAVDSDGVFLSCNSMDYNCVKNMILSDKIIGTDIDKSDFADYIITNKNTDKFAYILNSDSCEYKAVLEIIDDYTI